MMNFVNNIVSAWRCLISETHSNPAQQEVVQVLKGLLERWENGEIHKNPNGRWFQSFSLSECWLEENEWKFESRRDPDSRTRFKGEAESDGVVLRQARKVNRPFSPS